MKRSTAPGPRRSRPFRRILGGAVALGLTVTAGALASPAVAAPLEPKAPTLKIAPGSEIVSAGRTGFLSVDPQNNVVWTDYQGRTTKLAQDDWQYTHTTGHGAVSDIVALGNTPYIQTFSKITLRDMATGATTPVDLTKYGYRYAGTVEGWVVATKKAALGAEVHVLGLQGGETLTDRTVTGLPTDGTEFEMEAGAPGKALLRYARGISGTGLHGYEVVDLAAAKVVPTRGMVSHLSSNAALSATHMASIGSVNYGDEKIYLSVTETRADNPKAWSTRLPGSYMPTMGLVGDWVMYGNRGRVREGSSPDELAIRAVPAGGGTARKVMDHATSSTPTPDGDLLVMGGTVAQGEGLYRVSAKAGGGAPTVELVAGTGQPTKVTLLGSDVSNTAQLDQRRWHPRWHLSRRNVSMTITLRHNASGKRAEYHLVPDQGGESWDGWVDLNWDGLVNVRGREEAAPNGAYTWELTAEPRNGIGPALHQKGSFTVERKPAAHDYTDNGSPDVIVRDRAGTLSLEDTAHDPLNPHSHGRRIVVGGGWNIYDQVVAVGDVAGASHGDVVARDSAGVLWLYLGKGDGTFDKPLKVGAGWDAYDAITGGSDLNGDGRGDLLARDRSGVLWLYQGTGNWRAPFAPRKKIGGGWGSYDSITAVGDVAGASAGDVVARDRSGVLWLYLGKGDGTFDGRVKIGAGWGGYRQLIGIGDSNADGRADLLVSGPDNGTYVYHGTGNWRAPFAPPELAGITTSDETLA
ncbi:FG-GAP repeat domain-containing protein [Streptomyces chrestomyceticus]|uniref:FG-GAP repeat domain-containing protein n=1 Tax=Streptomyces chrestomyceticus TaxID=68185 RepID=UPI0019D071F6|nr:VCBS repeat-containing protein [Streptomyces chrestomyceticus]